MDVGIGGFETAGFGDFEVDVEDVRVSKKKKYDRIWKCGFGGSICGRPLYHEGVLYFGAMDHYVYAVNPGTGKILWKFNTGGKMLDSSPVAVETIVYIGTFEGNMHAIDTKTGEEVWRFRTGGEINTTGFIDKNILYFGSKDGYLYAVEASGGKEIWRFRAGGPIIAQLPRVYGDTIIFGCEDGNMYFMDMSGKEIGRFRTGGRIYGKFLMHEGKIYFGSWDCYLYAVDIETRSEIWRTPTSSMVQSKIPPVHEVYEAEIKKETQIDDAISEEKYKSKKEKSISLSDYQLSSEYTSTSEYRQKSDYDTSFIIFEGIMEEENIWISGSRVLSPDSRI